MNINGIYIFLEGLKLKKEHKAEWEKSGDWIWEGLEGG